MDLEWLIWDSFAALLLRPDFRVGLKIKHSLLASPILISWTLLIIISGVRPITSVNEPLEETERFASCLIPLGKLLPSPYDPLRLHGEHGLR